MNDVCQPRIRADRATIDASLDLRSSWGNSFVRVGLCVAVPPLLVWITLASLLPRWGVMWLMAIAMVAGCKALAWSARSGQDAPTWRKAAFLLAWPGMDANAFLSSAHSQVDRRLASDCVRGMLAFAGGAILFWGVARQVPADQPAIVAWLGMIGIVLMLHFGLLQLISCFWRWRGLNARPLMESPLQASSVGEFWGRRWNSGFRDLAAPVIFRPVARRSGVACATWITFLFSGIVHDLVISVPAGGGWGLPTGYFLLQAAAVQWEHSRYARCIGLHRDWPRRVFAYVAVLGPAGMLFHEPFRNQVVLPFMRACGAL